MFQPLKLDFKGSLKVSTFEIESRGRMTTRYSVENNSQGRAQ